ncbi:MAG: hypothetical protein H7323_04650, partial [Frankiales bacterium]|nr:hypothetical protein [Frankiales bacterium]
MRRSLVVVAGAALVVVAGSAVVVPRLLAGDDGDRQAAAAFARAWTAGTLADLPWAKASGADPAGQIATLTAALTPSEQDRPATVDVAGLTREGDTATAELAVRWELGARWEYRTRLPLVRTDGRWQPVLTPEVVHPDLSVGAVLRSRLVQPPRAAIT